MLRSSEDGKYGRASRRILLTTDVARLDVAAVHAYLTTSYWAEGIPLETLERSLQGSICFGLLHGARQVGFARIISDGATFAYLADVYVLEEFRGQDLGKWMMACMKKHPDLQGLRRWMLATRDAHGLYQQYGFQPLAKPERFMEILDPDVYGRRS